MSAHMPAYTPEPTRISTHMSRHAYFDTLACTQPYTYGPKHMRTHTCPHPCLHTYAHTDADTHMCMCFRVTPCEIPQFCLRSKTSKRVCFCRPQRNTAVLISAWLEMTVRATHDRAWHTRLSHAVGQLGGWAVGRLGGGGSNYTVLCRLWVTLLVEGAWLRPRRDPLSVVGRGVEGLFIHEHLPL